MAGRHTPLPAGIKQAVAQALARSGSAPRAQYGAAIAPHLDLPVGAHVSRTDNGSHTVTSQAGGYWPVPFGGVTTRDRYPEPTREQQDRATLATMERARMAGTIRRRPRSA